MANPFKSVGSASIGTVATVVGGYTVPVAFTATVVGYSLANRLATDITVSVIHTLSGTDYYIVKDAIVFPGTALAPVGGKIKLVLNTGDSLKVIASDAVSVDAIFSMLEVADV